MKAMTDRLAEDICFDQLIAHLLDQDRCEKEIEETRQAYEYARLKHSGQFRKNNENYIVHPVNVACILSEMPIDIATIKAALLHDVLEDTDATTEEIKTLFGEEVLKLVEGVTKLGKFKFSSKEDRQAENFRRMFIAMASDIRVILLKLSDRLHNMRTLCYMTPEKQVKIAKETLEIFAPLANRMGMGKIRAELEDLSFMYLYPDKFREIQSELVQSQDEREKTIELIINKIKAQLDELGTMARIYGRVKNYYSIYKKMLNRQKEFQDIYDISAVRVIVNSEKECYEVLGAIHHSFTPIPGRFKDYIAMPKSNLYQSLHTTVIGPAGRPLEVQIRTQEMHRIAEYGIAAHWKYKESGESTISTQTQEEQKLSWLRQMIQMKDDAGDAREYVDSIKLELFQDEVFIFTPKGEVIDLPKGSTPVDFAYRIHTEIGHSCTGAIVNGKIVTLNHVLRNGDIVEIIRSKKSAPRLDWIKFVKTQQAKGRIRQWFKKNFKQEHESQGRQLLEAELSRAEADEAIKNGKLLEIARELNYTTVEDLLTAVGYGEISLSKIINRLKKEDLLAKLHATQTRQSEADQHALEKIQHLRHAKPQTSTEIEGLKGMVYTLAKCCTPVPGEQIIAVVTRSRGVMVHREDCPNLATTNPDRHMLVDWSGIPGSDQKPSAHTVKLEIITIDRLGVFKDILTQIADSHTNVSNAKVRLLPDQTASIELSIDVHDVAHLERVLQAIRRVEDVISVKRQQSRTGNKNGSKI